MNDIDDNEENDTRPTDRRPLGYWLRAVDGLLTREFATALEAEGISRRDWMLLNVLSGDIDAPEFRERLARKGKRLRGLEERGWVEEQGDGTWVLTELGRSEQERIGAIVEGLRARVVAAVGDDEAYAALTGSLEKIARELGWDENAADGERGFGGFGRPGFGPGFRPGFGPGFRPGFGPGVGGRPRPFDPDIHDGYGHNRHRGYGDEGCHGHHPNRHGHGHGHAAHGHGHHGRGGRRTQQAYERGFDAGFARGRESGAA